MSDHGLFSLTGEVAVVIGGGGVLGGAMATGLAQAGADVVILGRSKDSADARARAIEALGRSCHWHRVRRHQQAGLQQALETVIDALWPRRHPGQRGRGEFRHALFRNYRSRMAPDSGYRPDQRISGLPGIRQGDGRCRARRLDHQYLFCLVRTAAVKGIHIRSGQSGRQSDHAVPGARTGAPQHPRECHSPRILPGRAKPQIAHPGAGGQHFGPYAP